MKMHKGIRFMLLLKGDRFGLDDITPTESLDKWTRVEPEIDKHLLDFLQHVPIKHKGTFRAGDKDVTQYMSPQATRIWEALPIDQDDYLYRVENYRSGNDMRVTIRRYSVVKHTPKGCWISYYGNRKFVLKNAKRKWAYPTAKEAIEHFIIRKQYERGHVQYRLNGVEKAIYLGKQMLKAYEGKDVKLYNSYKTPLDVS